MVIWGLFLAAGAVESTAGFAYDQIQDDIERVQNGDDGPKNKRRRRGPPRAVQVEMEEGEFDFEDEGEFSQPPLEESAFDRAARLESLEEFAANAALTERIASAIRWPLPKGVEIIDLGFQH